MQTTINELIQEMPKDACEAVVYLCYFWDSNSNSIEYDFLLDFYHLFQSMLDRSDFEVQFSSYDYTSPNLRESLRKVCSKLRPIISKKHIEKALEGLSTQNILSNDLTAIIQEKINELRNDITSCCLFSDEHKSRILSRLEKIQQELHKKIQTQKYCFLQ